MKFILQIIMVLLVVLSFQPAARAATPVYCTQDSDCYPGQGCVKGRCTDGGFPAPNLPAKSQTVQQTAPRVPQSSPPAPVQPAQTVGQSPATTTATAPTRAPESRGHKAAGSGAPADSPSDAHYHKRVLFPLMVGIPWGGEGTLNKSCNSTAQLCNDRYSSHSSLFMDEESGMSLETGVLFSFTSIRLGVIGNYNSNTQFRDNYSLVEFGTDLFLGGAFEWVPQLYPRGHLLLTMRLGGTILFADESIKNLSDQMNSACRDARANGLNCENTTSPFYGGTLGMGAGFIHMFNAVNLRIHLLATTTDMNLPSIKMWRGYSNVEEEWSLDEWLRLQFQIGLEF